MSCRGHKTWFSHSLSPPLVSQTLSLTYTHAFPLRGFGSTFNAPNYLGPHFSCCCITSGLAGCIFSWEMPLAPLCLLLCGLSYHLVAERTQWTPKQAVLIQSQHIEPLCNDTRKQEGRKKDTMSSKVFLVVGGDEETVQQAGGHRRELS